MAHRPDSILTDDYEKCFLCGSFRWIEIHHIFGGPNRKNSERYGLVVPLCHHCHNEPPYGVHHNEGRRLYLQAKAQRMFETINDHDLFMKVFGRDYIEAYKEYQDGKHNRG